MPRFPCRRACVGSTAASVLVGLATPWLPTWGFSPCRHFARCGSSWSGFATSVASCAAWPQRFHSARCSYVFILLAALPQMLPACAHFAMCLRQLASVGPSLGACSGQDCSLQRYAMSALGRSSRLPQCVLCPSRHHDVATNLASHCGAPHAGAPMTS